MRTIIDCGDGTTMNRTLCGRNPGLPALRGMVGLVLVSLLLVAGCGGGERPPVRTEVVPFTPEQQQQLASARDAVYRLRDGDRLAVDFKYEDGLDSTNLLVLPDGRLTLPGGIDPVPARGMSVSELDSTLTARFAEDYRNPELSVIIESLADLKVYVLGYVRIPGEVSLPEGGMGVIQAIAAAGGFDEDAQVAETVVMRVTEEGFILRQIDLSHLEKRGFPDLLALDLQPYDVIYVPRTTLGDFAYFSDSFIGGLLNFSELFWDIYAIANIDKVDNIWR